MSLRDLFFQLSPHDQQSVGIQLFIESSTSASADAFQGANIDPPTDRIIVLNRAQLFADPGAAQFVTDVALYLYALPNGGGTPYTLFLDETDLAANVNYSNSIQLHEMMLLAPWSIQIEANFNAAVAANTARLTLFGYSVPRGYVVP